VRRKPLPWLAVFGSCGSFSAEIIRLADPLLLNPRFFVFLTNQLLWIQIGSVFNGVPRSVFGSGFAIRTRIQDGKNGPENRKQLINFIFCSAGCSLSRAEGFFCSLDVLWRTFLQSLIKKETNISALFFSILVSKILDPYPVPDLQHWKKLSWAWVGS
jgi:hypothetical protein